jgi:hypothetical protein
VLGREIVCDPGPLYEEDYWLRVGRDEEKITYEDNPPEE